MTLPFIVIACGARKREHKTQAQHLYTGPLFTSTLAYARTQAPDDRIVILSAKHGLISLTTTLQPYNVSINQANTAWLTRRVSEQIPQLVPPMLWATDITVLAGEQYVDILGAAWMIARDEAPDFQRPLRGIGLGMQLQWLKKELREFAREVAHA